MKLGACPKGAMDVAHLAIKATTSPKRGLSRQQLSIDWQEALLGSLSGGRARKEKETCRRLGSGMHFGTAFGLALRWDVAWISLLGTGTVEKRSASEV